MSSAGVACIRVGLNLTALLLFLQAAATFCWHSYCIAIVNFFIFKRYVLKRPLQEPETDDDESQPPPGKRKKRGQNKQRPRAIIPYSQLLCPKLHSAHGGEGCRYGDKCRYLHDVARYMAVKPPDIGDRCYVYDTFGKCGYGAACRFALSHLTPDFANVVNEALYDPNRPSPLVNAVPKGLQENLRKKRFAFPRSDAFLRKLQAGGGLKAACDGNVTGETEEDRLPNEANNRADTDPGGKQGLATARCCEDLVGGEPGSVQPEPRGKGEGCCETGTMPEAASVNGGAGILSEAQSSRTMEKSEGSVVEVEVTPVGVTSAGVVTDEDVICLRAAEKKKARY